jgi:NADPH:quinone reductase-like Zn-dependent oxidoreductase
MDLAGQRVVVIGGTSGVGLETARLAREHGATLILTARNADRLHRVGLELGASIAAFDAADDERLERFFVALAEPVDHVLVGVPALVTEKVARTAAARVRGSGAVIFVDCGSVGSPASNGAFAPVRVNRVEVGPPPFDPAAVARVALALMTNAEQYDRER